MHEALKQKRKKAAVIISLVFFVLIPYSNSLFNGFVYDDNTLIVDNPAVKNIKNIGSAFEHDFWWGTKTGFSGFYRPLTIISYALNYHFSENKPLSFHLTNVVLHLIAVIIVFFFVSLLFEGLTVPFLSAALFAVHPIHTEAVTWAAGRPEILAAIFFMGSLCLYLKSSDSERSLSSSSLLYSLSLILYFLALLSKEHAIILLAVLPVISAFIDSRKSKIPGIQLTHFLDRKRLLSLLGYACVTVFYISIRWKVIGSGSFRTKSSILDNPLIDANFLEKIVTAPVLFFKYISLMVIPVKLSADYSAWQIPVSTIPPSPIDVIAWLMSASFLVLLLSAYSRAKEFFLPLSFFAITYFIPSNLFITIGTIFGERLMYLPSVGICMLFGIGAQLACGKVTSHQQKNLNVALVCCLIGIILLFFSARTFVRNFDWKDDFTLFSATVKVSPRSARAHGNLGQALETMGKFDEALREYNRSISIYPRIERVHVNMGNIYAANGRNEEALKEYLKALDINPRSADAHYNSAILYESLGSMGEAEKEYLKAIEFYPAHEEAMNNLGALYLKEGKFSDALELFQKAYETSPEKVLSLRNQGEAYIKLQDYQSAEAIIRKYLEQAGKDSKGHYLLAFALTGQKKYRGAIDALRETIELRDDVPDLHLMLSNLYRQIGMEKESREELTLYQQEIKK